MVDVPNPFTDPVILGVIGLAIGLAFLTYVEVKHVRKSLREERLRKVRRNEDLPDEAHNAILTAKAVSAALQRAGVTTDQADSLISEAEMAMAHRNFRVALDLTDRAKGTLKAEKARHDRMGDLAKLEKVATTRADGPTTKEQLAHDHPPNYLASKFAIEMAEEAVAAGHRAARDVGPAEQLTRRSKEQFAAGDFGAALTLAVKARKASGGASVGESASESAVTPPAPAASAPTCPQCESPIAADDVFCRKCGAKIAS